MRIDYSKGPLPAPSMYNDPDAYSAAHLVCAAWHLYEAGQEAAAKQMSDIAAAMFESVEPDKKGVKKLGDALYMPAGILEASGRQIPAPAFDAPVPESTETVKRLILSECRSELGWFPARQAAARIDGQEKPKLAAGAKPAKMLAQIQGLCGSFTPDMPGHVITALSGKLRSILKNSSLSIRHGSRENIYISFYAGRYRFRFHYLTEGQLGEIFYNIDLEHGRLDQQSLANNIMGVRSRMPEFSCGGILGNSPFGGLTSDSALETTAWSHTRGYIISQAADAASDVMNLALVHNAMLNIQDGYIQGVFRKAGMAEPGLKIQRDLAARAAGLLFTGLMLENDDPDMPAGESVRDDMMRKLMPTPDPVNI